MTTPGYLPTGAIPDYVPPHLRGKVWDFKNEDDGTVSFAHPEASLGLSPEQSRVKLNAEQYANTFDQAHRLGNLSKSMTAQYAPLERKATPPAKNINDGIANFLRSALGWGTSSQGKAIGTAGLLSALGGGVASSMWDLQKGNDVSPNKALLLALLAGAAGAATTAWGQNKYNRRENFLSRNAQGQLPVTDYL
jgi:hypothetical protein